MDKNSSHFKLFLDEIIKWNNKINLVSKYDIPLLEERHLKDSLIPVAKILDGSVVADIGSGNGFPVIPLAIAKKECSFHAFESREKRCIFLENVIRKLSLNNITIHCGMVENQYNKLKNGADYIISRAFRNNVKFVEIGLPLLKNNGTVISYNDILINEIEELEKINKIIIKNVDKCVYNLLEDKKRVLSLFSIKRAD